jgi:hypothetical protein
MRALLLERLPLTLDRARVLGLQKPKTKLLSRKVFGVLFSNAAKIKKAALRWDIPPQQINGLGCALGLAPRKQFYYAADG